MPRERCGQSLAYRVTSTPNACVASPSPCCCRAVGVASFVWNAGCPIDHTNRPPGFNNCRTPRSSGPIVGRSINANEQTAASNDAGVASASHGGLVARVGDAVVDRAIRRAGSRAGEVDERRRAVEGDDVAARSAEPAAVVAVATTGVEHPLAGDGRQQAVGGRHHELLLKVVPLADLRVPIACEPVPDVDRRGVHVAAAYHALDRRSTDPAIGRCPIRAGTRRP